MQTTPIRFQGITYKIQPNDNRSVVELGKQPGGLGAELCNLYRKHKTDIELNGNAVTFDKPKAAREFEKWLKEQELNYTCGQLPPLQSIYNIQYDNQEQAGIAQNALEEVIQHFIVDIDGNPNDDLPKITVSGPQGKEASKHLASWLKSSGIKFDRRA